MSKSNLEELAEELAALHDAARQRAAATIADLQKQLGTAQERVASLEPFRVAWAGKQCEQPFDVVDPGACGRCTPCEARKHAALAGQAPAL